MGFDLPTPQFANGVSVSAIKSLFNISYNDYYNICVNTPDANLNPWGFLDSLAAFRAAPYQASELKYYDHYYPQYTYTSTISGQWGTYQNGQVEFDLAKLRTWMRFPTFEISVYLTGGAAGSYDANNFGQILNVNLTSGYFTVTLNPSVTTNALTLFGGAANQMVNIPSALNQNQTYYLHIVLNNGYQYLQTPPAIDGRGNYKILVPVVVGQQVINQPTLGFYVTGTYNQSPIYAGLTANPKSISTNNPIYNLMRYDYYVISQDNDDPIFSQQVTFDINTVYSVTNIGSGSNTIPKVTGTGVVRCVVTSQDTDYKYESHSYDWTLEAGQVV